ncbi:hypothetical protein Dxin01_02770 [Deinococcus xinjiangensis]|uniref:Uncharacterized protein n=1 Tax=Deinococcus xinjiangensis TaxID=457454 RepID=A0ABP9VE77_9DEIO
MADLQAHVDAQRDWYDTPLDCIMAVYRAWQAGQTRAFARAVTTGQLAAGALGGDAKYFKKVIDQGEKASIPDPTKPFFGSVGDQMPTPEQPYPISATVATDLGAAMGAGLLTGPVLSSWPASREGLPLSRIWGRIEAAMPRKKG